MTATKHAASAPTTPQRPTPRVPAPPTPPRRGGRRWDPHLRLVRHAIGLKLAMELGDPNAARTEADALLDALAAADQEIPTLTPPPEEVAT